MKTSLTFFKPLLWDELLKRSRLLLSFCWRWVLKSMREISQHQLLAHRVTPIFRNVLIKVNLKKFFSSRGVYAGLTLVVLGLLSKHVYQLFDPALRGELPYYQNLYWYFWTIRIQMKDIFFCVGVFIAFPTKNAFKWLVVLNMFDSTMEIIHYTFYTISDETFHLPFNDTVLVLGYTLPVLLLALTDFIVWAYNHRIRAYEGRLDGLYQVADELPDSKFKSMFKVAYEENRAFKKTF